MKIFLVTMHMNGNVKEKKFIKDINKLLIEVRHGFE